MNRGKIVVPVVLILIVLGIYLTIPERKGDEKYPEEDFFCRTIRMVSPPDFTVNQGGSLKIPRWLDRIQWGTSPSVNWTIDCLKNNPDRSYLQDVYSRIDRLKVISPTQAKRYIDLLAELEEPDSLQILIACTKESNKLIRQAAIRGVSRFPQDAATNSLLEIARSANEEDKRVSMSHLKDRQSAEVAAFFKEILADPKAPGLTSAMEGLADRGDETSAQLIRPFLNHEQFVIRSSALNALLRLNDPVALDHLVQQLRFKGPVIKRNAIQSLAHTKELPDKTVLEELTREEDPEIRMHFVDQLVTIQPERSGKDLETIEGILQIFKEDSRPEIRLKALEGLYKAGHHDVAKPFLKRLEIAYGNTLNEALGLTTEVLQLREQAGPILIERFRHDSDLSPADRLRLLEGMAHLKDPAAIPLFFEVILGAWNSRALNVDPFTLDRHAAFKVHSLEGDVITHWLSALKEDGSDNLVYLFINSARNLGSSQAADFLLEAASDSARPIWLRKEAVLSMAFLRNPELGPRLWAYGEQEKNPDISGLAFKVFWNFF